MCYSASVMGKRTARTACRVVSVVALLVAALHGLAHAEPEGGGKREGQPERSEPRSGGNVPYRPDPSPHASGAKRELKIEAGPGAKVLRIPIQGTIDLGLAAFIERALEAQADAKLV